MISLGNPPLMRLCQMLTSHSLLKSTFMKLWLLVIIFILTEVMFCFQIYEPKKVLLKGM